MARPGKGKYIVKDQIEVWNSTVELLVRSQAVVQKRWLRCSIVIVTGAAVSARSDSSQTATRSNGWRCAARVRNPVPLRLAGYKLWR